jgi:hypothetical protein
MSGSFASLRQSAPVVLMSAIALLAACETSITETPVPVASLGLEAQRTILSTGQTVQLSATPRSAEGDNLSARGITWSTSNAATAEVSNSGLVTAVNPGAVTITATSESASEDVDLTIVAPPRLIITGTGTGNGEVGGPSVYCPIALGVVVEPCEFSFAYGTAVTLNTEPDPEHTFVGWSGSCTGAQDCTLSMTENRSVSANIARPTGPLIAYVSHVLETEPASCDPAYDTVTVIRFSYSDVNGNVVAEGTPAILSLQVQSDPPFEAPWPVGYVSGDGFNGVMELGVCAVWGDVTVMTFRITLHDAGGLASNIMTLDIVRSGGVSTGASAAMMPAPAAYR